MTVVLVFDLRDRAPSEVAKLDSRRVVSGRTGSKGSTSITLRDAKSYFLPHASRRLAVQMLRHIAPGSACRIETKALPPG
jgi:hypothetical protein